MFVKDLYDQNNARISNIAHTEIKLHFNSIFHNF